MTSAYRRARSLILHWQDGELLAENYLAEKSTDHDEPNAVTVDPVTLDLLERFADWRPAEEVAAELPEFSTDSVLEAVGQLEECGLLVRRGDAAAAQEEALLREWRHWSVEARFFHFGTKDAVYIGDDEEHRRAAAEVVTATGPAPPIFKSHPDAPQVYLPRALLPLDQPFGEVLTGRRTIRDFTAEPVTLAELSTVLHYTFGPMHFVDGREFGTLFLRTSPSGGARQELECYLAVRDVAGLPPAIYHYRAENHSLELLDPGHDPELVDRLCFAQRMCADAAFLCFVTAVFDRSMYKYRHPRAYRVTLLGAGHLGQTFALTCTALGLGPFQTAALRDSETEAALGVDGFAEAVLYLLGAGRPAPRPGPNLPELEPAAVTRESLVGESRHLHDH
ncbi:MAG: SagB/ThcOx family dehydrogenase [Streptosporangiales bacterium]|nr:SagB/ThcOx family dehydrogenase [Streptosporangiales bacterium]